MERRDFLKLAACGGLGLALRGRVALGAPMGQGAGALWVHIQATGGWDQALFCDPKPSVRANLSAADQEVRQAGNIPYLAFADFGQPAGQGFFGQFYDRLLVLNGVDTATNNHELGIRYSSTGSSNDGYPCLAAQLAAVYGQAQPLAFLDYGGYDQTADLLAPTRLQLGQGQLLGALQSPNAVGGGQGKFMQDSTSALVTDAHKRRLMRLLAQTRLPGAQQAVATLQQAREAQKGLGQLVIPPDTSTYQHLVDLGFSGYQQGLSVSIGLILGGFDSHSNNEALQAQYLQVVFNMTSYIITQSEQRGLPVVVVLTSDFGRTPHYTGTGTDHWPISSVLVLQNRVALGKGLGLPANQVIGGTTSGGDTQALRASKVDPATLLLSDTGITITPGHVYRALRRVARIDGSDSLRRFPITVDRDLSIG